MSRIPHLEDLLFEDGDISAVLNGIKNRYFPVTVKWDGSPSFVAGQGFVAFKTGFEKKEPILYRSEKELDRGILCPNLLSKMKLIFDKLSSSETLLFGDFLFDREMLESGVIQPNTIKYQLEADPDQYDLGVAIHKGTFQMQRVDRVYYAPISPIIYYCVEYVPLIASRPLRPVEKTKLVKYINGKVREDNLFDLVWHEAGFNHDFQEVLDDYITITHWKHSLLESMEVKTKLKPADGYAHEGLVIIINGRQVKLVDRTKFSRLNFERHRNGRQSVQEHSTDF